MVLEKVGIHREEKMNFNLRYDTKTKLKWVTDLHVIHKTIKLLEKNCRIKSSKPRAQQRVLRHPKHGSLKGKNDKLDFIKCKYF